VHCVVLLKIMCLDFANYTQVMCTIYSVFIAYFWDFRTKVSNYEVNQLVKVIILQKLQKVNVQK